MKEKTNKIVTNFEYFSFSAFMELMELNTAACSPKQSC